MKEISSTINTGMSEMIKGVEAEVAALTQIKGLVDCSNKTVLENQNISKELV